MKRHSFRVNNVFVGSFEMMMSNRQNVCAERADDDSRRQSRFWQMHYFLINTKCDYKGKNSKRERVIQKNKIK